MSYLVDFDWVLDLLSEVTEAIELLDKLSEDSIAISIITYMEVYQGIVRSPDPNESQEKFDAFLEGVVGVNSEYVRKITTCKKIISVLGYCEVPTGVRNGTSGCSGEGIASVSITYSPYKMTFFQFRSYFGTVSTRP